MKTSPDHKAADVDNLSEPGLFNLPRAAGRTLMSMTANLMLISLIHYVIKRTNRKTNKSPLDNSPMPLLNMSVNWLLVICLTNLSRIHEKTYHAHKVKLFSKNAKNSNKPMILNCFSAVIEPVRELVISNLHNKFDKDMNKVLSYRAQK